jgi:hypothetical protein
MADLNKTLAVRDSSAALTLNNGAASQTIVWNGQDEKVALYVKNTDAAQVTVTVKAGTGIRSAIGDLSVNVAAGAETVIGPLDSMRFKERATGKVTVTIAGGTASNVKLAVIQLP